MTKADCLKQLQAASDHKGFWTINAQWARIKVL